MRHLGYLGRVGLVPSPSHSGLQDKSNQNRAPDGSSERAGHTDVYVGHASVLSRRAAAASRVVGFPFGVARGSVVADAGIASDRGNVSGSESFLQWRASPNA